MSGSAINDKILYTTHQTKAHAFLNEVTSTHFLPTWFDPTTSPALITFMLMCICMCMCVWSLNSATTPELDRLWNYDVNLRQEIESGCKLNPSHCFMSNCQSKFCFNRSVTVWVLVFNKYDDRCQSLDQINYPILVWIKKGGSQCPYLFSVFCY